MDSPSKIDSSSAGEPRRKTRLAGRFLTVYRWPASDFADQIQGRRQGIRARRPLRGAHLARVRGDVLRGLYLAQQFLRIAADAVVVHFHDLDQSLGVDDEGAAQRETFLLDQHLEVACERRRGVADQRVLHLDDGIGSVVPGLVREMRVRGYAV